MAINIIMDLSVSEVIMDIVSEKFMFLWLHHTLEFAITEN